MLEEYLSMQNPGPIMVPNVPIQNFDDMSEDSQLDVIERALYGDLKGIIEVTQKDMELYNRRKGMSRTGYVSQAEMDKRHQEWVASHPNEVRPNVQAETYSSTNPNSFNFANQNCTLANYNPYIGGGYKPQNSYPNPYGGSYNPYAASPAGYNQQMYYNTYGGYYNGGGYYGSYPYYGGYQQQQPIQYADPVFGFALSKIDQMSNMYHTGQFNQNQYYAQSFYQQPTETICINPVVENNQLQVKSPSQRSHLFIEESRKFFKNGVSLPVAETEQENKYAQIPTEAINAYRSYYSNYYNMTPMQRALNQPPPYVYSQQFKDAVKQYYDNQQMLQHAIASAVFEYSGLGSYDEYLNQQKQAETERLSEQYRQIYEQDAGLSPEDKAHNTRVRREADELFERGAGLATRAYSFVPRWGMTPQQFVQTAYAMSPMLRDQYRYINPDQTFSEFIIGCNRYATHLENVEFARNARKAYMGDYDKDCYRSAIVTDNPNAKNSMLGFNMVYDPIRRQSNQVISPHAGLADQYAAKRAAYMQSANMIRGGTGSVV